jgi:hypothetical protein
MFCSRSTQLLLLNSVLHDCNALVRLSLFSIIDLRMAVCFSNLTNLDAMIRSLTYEKPPKGGYED